jgi:hypothetical protein
MVSLMTGAWNLPNYIPDVQMVLYADDINILIVDKEEN